VQCRDGHRDQEEKDKEKVVVNRNVRNSNENNEYTRRNATQK
jgi:hypothetical protein